MINQLRGAVQLMKAGAWTDIRQATRAYWRSDSETIGLRRDLSISITAPSAAIPLTIRELRPADVPILFACDDDVRSGEAMRQRAIRLRMTQADLKTCYVAANDDDQPCYVQWLIGPSEKEKLRELFDDRFPTLRDDEMLLEGAFTLEAWRGKGIMAAAMARIAASAADHDARWVITFVAEDNIPSLKGCKKAGFEPYLRRADRWRMFRHASTFGQVLAAAD
jgi:GNAT superfamily N-acetyltransferase